MPINYVIKEKRKELGLTQEQIAVCLGVSTPAVNKWEKGAAYPDITLLPPLARLLKVDINTLLCFNETLTEQEVRHFITKLSQVIQKDGLDSGFKTGIEKVREYPNCGQLIHLTAVTLEMALLMSGIHTEEKKQYEDQILALYERNIGCDNESIRIRSTYMLASKYMNLGVYDKTQELLNLLPDQETPDKKLLETDLLIHQNRLDQAEELLERRLITKINEIMMLFSKLADIELKQGNEQNAAHIADVFSNTAKQLELWDYSRCVLPLSVAVGQQNIPKSLSILESILSAAEKPWDTEKTVLYRHIKNPAPEASTSTFASAMLPPLLSELESSPKYNFLHSTPQFQHLIHSYRLKYPSEPPKS
ncbi:helix-turn-helix domain-containing protein [Clostridium sp. MCC353]|uniref:helix-turn-helix domain-containing protein n=1 Tax=Clostridium sp. MCC353 TaxID=2592646 RepID=UPI001C02AC24|nr:helix-turn-helix transcriptional regulator [Clostridium sp. MCC353]MBT9779076.1 helix-turn-helix domain-containing protein [Clostridium sp. MCC353]